MAAMAMARVGVIDVALGVRHGACVTRIFYPAEAMADDGRKARWLPDTHAAYGYLDYATSGSWGIACYVVALGMSLLDVLATTFSARAYTFTRARASSLVYGAKPSLSPSKRPCVVFSHGLAGTRTTYSGLCARIASKGYIVVAIEHRDGTASSSRPLSRFPQANFRMDAAYAQQQRIPPEKEEAGSSVAEGIIARGRAARFVPDDVTSTYVHINPSKQDLLDMRRDQTSLRCTEMRAARTFLMALERGDCHFSSGRDDDTSRAAAEQARRITDALRPDSSRSYAVGHSFGAISALVSADDDDHDRVGALHPVLKCVALDPWFYVLDGYDTNDLILRRRVPVCIINSCGWNPRWIQPISGCNNAVLRRLAEQQELHDSKFEIQGTRHASSSDVPSVLHAWMSPFMGAMRVASWFFFGRSHGDARDVPMDPNVFLDAIGDMICEGFLPWKELTNGANDPMRDVLDSLNASHAVNGAISSFPV